MYGSRSPPQKKVKQEKKPKKATSKQAKKPKELTPAQLKRLEKHSVHHSNKHMNMMKKDMMMGMTFKAAHEKAQSKVGK